MRPPSRTNRRRSLHFFVAFFVTSLTILWVAQPSIAQKTAAPEKRSVTHNDYDIWNTIQTPQIAPDGSFLAYTLSSGKGDNVLIVRNIHNDKEYRFGGKSGDAAKKTGQPQGNAGKTVFTADSKLLVFTITPGKGGAKKVDKDKDKEKKEAKDKEQKKAEEPVRTNLGIMDLSTGEIKVIPGVRTFTIPEESFGFMVYHKLPPPGPKTDEKKVGMLDDVDDEDAQVNSDGIWFDGVHFVQKGKKGGAGGGPAPKQAGVGGPKATASDLVLHRFADGVEEVIPDVTDFFTTRDGTALICTIAGKGPDDMTGLYAFGPTPSGKLAKLPLAAGKAKYSRFTWDEKQRRLAFFADHGSSPKESAIRVMLWDRDAPVNNGNSEGAAAAEVLDFKTAKGLKPGYSLVERAGLSLSDEGNILVLGAALPQEKEPEVMGGAKDDKALVELWHWKDDFIQPMMKIRGPQEKARTYSTVYHVKTKKLVQLADKTMPTANLVRDGSIAIGGDDTPHRHLVAFDGNYSDYYLVNAFDGKRRPLLKKHQGGVSQSPSGKYATYFDGKNWNVVSLPGGGVTNLTKDIQTKFWNEDHDSPSAPGSFGIAGWSSDEYYVLIYDKYDIWEVSSKGNSFRNLTESAKRAKNTQYRYLKLNPKDKGIDMNRPLFLRTENLKTRDEGFASLDTRAGRGADKLIEQPCAFGNPVKARDGNFLLLTAQTHFKYPDLYVATMDFKQSIRVTDAQPRQAEFIWGQAQLIHYKNADGVPLSGILIRPENFDDSKKYPLMVYIYEKLSQNLHNFVLPKEGTSINATYYASNGYMVLMPDIVYTVGYPGQSALKCVLPAIQAVVDKGNVDENAIGIQGHSWGGYQISYMVTQTNRFKAAAAGAPVANMTSAYDGIRWGTGLPRQFQYEKTQSRIGGTLWEHPMRFIENSPIFMADRVKTPLMILHNDQDDAVPWYQGIEYYLALRRLGKEVYMFNYLGEKHGIGKKANKMDYTMRMQQFFDHNLRGMPRPEWMEKGLPYVPKGAAKDPPAGKGEPPGGGGGGR